MSESPSRGRGKRVRLIYIIGTYPGLTTTFIDREIKGLRQWGLDLQVVSIRRPAESAPLSTEQRELGQDVIYLLPVNKVHFIGGHIYFALFRPQAYFKTLFYLLTQPYPDLKAWLMTWLHFAEGVYAAFLLRERPLDQLHAHFADRAAVVALVASHLLNVPYSLTAHANDIYVKPILLRAKVSEAKFVCTCTRYNQAHLLRIMGENLKDKLHLVYHGLDLTDYQPPLSRRQSNCPLILSVGRLTEKKGFSYLINACCRLKERGYHFTCHIVGEGPLRQELETLITHLGLEDTVVLCGAIPHTDVIEEYRQAALFVLPCIVALDGDRDGIPNVLIEAMAMEVPVVSTCHSGIPELVQDRSNGILVPPGDLETLAGALAELLGDPELRRSFGQRGRKRVQEDFDAEHSMRRLVDLFVA